MKIFISETNRKLFSRSKKRMPLCNKIGSISKTYGRMRGCPGRSLLKITNKSKSRQETCYKEMVLHSKK